MKLLNTETLFLAPKELTFGEGKKKLLFNHPLAPHSHLYTEIQNHLRCTKTKILFPDLQRPLRTTLPFPPQEKVHFKPDHSSVPVYRVVTNSQEGRNMQADFTTANNGACSPPQRWAPLRHTNFKQLTHDSTNLPVQTAQAQSVVRVSSLNSLSLHWTEVIWATCPSHMLASPLLSSRHSLGHRVEKPFLVGFSTCTSLSCCRFFTLCHMTEKSWLWNC